MRGFNKPTFSLSWEKKVVEMCQNLSCVQVWLLQNGPGNNLIVSDQAVDQFLMGRPRDTKFRIGQKGREPLAVDVDTIPGKGKYTFSLVFSGGD